MTYVALAPDGTVLARGWAADIAEALHPMGVRSVRAGNGLDGARVTVRDGRVIRIAATHLEPGQHPDDEPMEDEPRPFTASDNYAAMWGAWADAIHPSLEEEQA